MHLQLFVSAAILFLVTAENAAESKRGKRLNGGTFVGNGPGMKYNFFVNVYNRQLNVNGQLDPHYHEASGVLYNREYVLTVAHPLSANGVYRRVTCGNNVRNVAKVIIHPDFDLLSQTPLLPNDLAILKLDSPMPLDQYCQPATLISDPINSWTLRVAGWGYVWWSSTMKFVEAELNALNRQQCNYAYATYVNGDIHLCGTDYSQQQSRAAVCSGDAGIPALVDNTVVGLASWSDQFCQWPAVFTRLSAFMDWVTLTIAVDQSGSPANDAPTVMPDSAV